MYSPVVSVHPSQHRRQTPERGSVAGLTYPILRVYAEIGEDMREKPRIVDEEVRARGGS